MWLRVEKRHFLLLDPKRTITRAELVTSGSGEQLQDRTVKTSDGSLVG